MKRQDGARKNVETYEQFGLRHVHCQACGIDAMSARRMRWPGLSRHHIVKPGRSDEDCNLLMLCSRCHEAAENIPQRGAGPFKGLFTLPLAVCLTLKAIREPRHFDPARLTALRGLPLPDPQPISEIVEAEFRLWRPVSRLLFQNEDRFHGVVRCISAITRSA